MEPPAQNGADRPAVLARWWHARALANWVAGWPMMVTMTTTRGDGDHASLQRRLEVLKLPVVPVEHHGFLAHSDRGAMRREPDAVGVGSDGTAFAVWSHRKNSRREQVT